MQGGQGRVGELGQGCGGSGATQVLAERAAAGAEAKEGAAAGAGAEVEAGVGGLLRRLEEGWRLPV